MIVTQPPAKRLVAALQSLAKLGALCLDQVRLPAARSQVSFGPGASLSQPAFQNHPVLTLSGQPSAERQKAPLFLHNTSLFPVSVLVSQITSFGEQQDVADHH
jgi:hypothetical protein